MHAMETRPSVTSFTNAFASSREVRTTTIPPFKLAWSFRNDSAAEPRPNASVRASPKPTTPAAYAAAISPLEWPMTALGVIPQELRRSVKAIWIAVHADWPILGRDSKDLSSSLKSSSESVRKSHAVEELKITRQSKSSTKTGELLICLAHRFRENRVSTEEFPAHGVPLSPLARKNESNCCYVDRPAGLDFAVQNRNQFFCRPSGDRCFPWQNCASFAKCICQVCDNLVVELLWMSL